MPASFIAEWNGIVLEQKIKETGPKRLREAALLAQREIKQTLTGQRSGRTYRVPGTRRQYTASAPGEPPAVRTGRLRSVIRIEVDKDKMEAVVGPEKMAPDYPAMLEFGTQGHLQSAPVSVGGSHGLPTPARRSQSMSMRGRMAPRPFMAPTFLRIKSALQNILTAPWL